MTYLSDHVTTQVIPATVWTYEFPNGRTASVIPDPHTPLTFELLASDDPRPHGALTTDQVRAKLTELAESPAVAVDLMAPLKASIERARADRAATDN